MSTRRRIGVSIATSEAARRQLMAPVPCWEKVWDKPDNAPPGSTLRVYKWIKTDKVQQFSDDESEVDAPLAPLPDEPEAEVVEGDEEVDQDEVAPSVAPEAAPLGDALEPASQEDDLTSKLSIPKPDADPLSLEPPSAPIELEEANDNLDESLKPLDNNVNGTAGMADELDPDMLENLDMSQLPPDGTSFEDTEDLSQLQEDDVLLGGQMMDQSSDPFAAPAS